jgi:hypothetical protein
MASSHLKAGGDEPGAKTFELLTLENPGITKPRYAVWGRVRYANVDGEGYLETWNCFPGGERYYSRTRLSAGPMASLRGSSNWRDFVLPYYMDQDTRRPDKLVVNLVLPGRGTVWVGPLRLVQYDLNEDPCAAPGEWWGERTAGVVGGLCGVTLGILGALIGCLTSTGRGRAAVLGGMKGMIAVGGASLVVGVAAVLLGQPYHVYYLLLLSGFLAAGLPLVLLSTCRKRFEEMELRKIAAMDA